MHKENNDNLDLNNENIGSDSNNKSLNIPDSLLFLKDYCKVDFNDGKIIIRQESDFLNYIISYLSFGCVFVMIYFIQAYYKLFKKNDPLIIVLQIFYFVFFFIFYNFIHYSKVIDYKNDCFYSELYIFGLTFHFNKFNKSEILQVTNNIVPSAKNPAGKCGTIEGKPVIPYEFTNLFHRYYVSFLLVNGAIYDFIEVGVFEENYNDSVALSHKFSEYLNIPVFVCENGKKIKKSKLVEGKYVLEPTVIGYISDIVKGGGVLLFVFFSIVFPIILLSFGINFFVSFIIMISLSSMIFFYI